MKTYIKDIDKDEIRSGFLVTTGRKKIWNKEIELFLEVDRICQKYDIKYFALFGTMLGTVRHKGFIPWDDDIDVAMMRPDYMRFVQVAIQEIKTPYFLQNAYTDNRIMNWSKIMDDRTSAIEDWNADMHQGMFVDIFPLDAVSDGTKKGALIDEMCKELWMCVITPQQVADGLKNGANTHVAQQTLQRIIDMSLTERMNIYEDFCLKHFEESAVVGFQPSFWCGEAGKYTKTLFSEVNYIQFEMVKLPLPTAYEYILEQDYGDWHTLKHSPTAHEDALISPDIPYDVLLRNINKELLDSVDFYWEA